MDRSVRAYCDTASPRPFGRLLIGALAGLSATSAMTAAMRRLHRHLPAEERYPLPPREIVETVAGVGSDEADLRDRSLAAHFAFGAAAGAVMTAIQPRPGPAAGATFGMTVWAASYFGWAPGFAILRPANEHPARRNALMIGVHLIWGAVAALTARELGAARQSILADGPLRDADRKDAR